MGSRTLLVKDVMVAARPAAESRQNLRDAAERLREANALAIPVLDEDRYVGLLCVDHLVMPTQGADPAIVRAGEIALRPAAFCEAEQSLPEAAARMVSARARYLPVLDRAGRCLGVMTVESLTVVPEGRDWVEQVLAAAADRPDETLHGGLASLPAAGSS